MGFRAIIVVFRLPYSVKKLTHLRPKRPPSLSPLPASTGSISIIFPPRYLLSPPRSTHLLVLSGRRPYLLLLYELRGGLVYSGLSSIVLSPSHLLDGRRWNSPDSASQILSFTVTTISASFCLLFVAPQEEAQDWQEAICVSDPPCDSSL